MTDVSQVEGTKQVKEPMNAESAVEFSILFALLAGSGVSGDTDKYRDIVVSTFTKMLDGFGYKIAPK